MSRSFGRAALAGVLCFSGLATTWSNAAAAGVADQGVGEVSAHKDDSCPTGATYADSWHELESGDKNNHKKGDRRMTVHAYVLQLNCDDGSTLYLARARIENYKFRGVNPHFQRDVQFTSLRGSYSWTYGGKPSVSGKIEKSGDVVNETINLGTGVAWWPGNDRFALTLDVEVSEDAIGAIPIHMEFVTG